MKGCKESLNFTAFFDAVLTRWVKIDNEIITESECSPKEKEVGLMIIFNLNKEEKMLQRYLCK